MPDTDSNAVALPEIQGVVYVQVGPFKRAKIALFFGLVQGLLAVLVGAKTDLLFEEP